MTLTQARAAFPSAFSIIPPFRPVTLFRPRSFMLHTMSPSWIARKYTIRWSHTREQSLHTCETFIFQWITWPCRMCLHLMWPTEKIPYLQRALALFSRQTPPFGRKFTQTRGCVAFLFAHTVRSLILLFSYSYYSLWKMERERNDA